MCCGGCIPNGIVCRIVRRVAHESLPQKHDRLSVATPKIQGFANMANLANTYAGLRI
jgi:hypothetical protein